MRYHVEPVGTYGYLLRGEGDVVRGERTCAGAKVVSHPFSLIL